MMSKAFIRYRDLYVIFYRCLKSINPSLSIDRFYINLRLYRTLLSLRHFLIVMFCNRVYEFRTGCNYRFPPFGISTSKVFRTLDYKRTYSHHLTFRLPYSRTLHRINLPSHRSCLFDNMGSPKKSTEDDLSNLISKNGEVRFPAPVITLSLFQVAISSLPQFGGRT